VAINIELKITATAIIPERKWLNTVKILFAEVILTRKKISINWLTKLTTTKKNVKQK